MTTSMREIVGIIPAGGKATRLSPLPCSKEIFPVGFYNAEGGQGVRPKPVGQYLLEHFRRAGASRAYIIIRKGKWDIPEYFGDGSSLDLPIGYLIMSLPYGTPYTVDQAYAFVRDANIIFGFPDILIEPKDTYPRLIAHLNATKADVVLGLFPTEQPQLCDPIVFDEQGRILEILIKPDQSDLRITWTVAAWTPSFTRFLHEYLAEVQQTSTETSLSRELYMSQVIMAAIKYGLQVEGLHLPGARFLDIGVPENLVQALRAQLASPGA